MTASVELVLGAPGTGTSQRAVQEVIQHVTGGGRLEEVLVLAPTRAAATDLRERLEAELGVAATGMPVHSHQAFGFAVLAQRARREGLPAPTLLSGADQDAVLAELLQSSTGAGHPWPEEVVPALGTQGFRDELRDLFARAVEHGVTASELAALDDHQGEHGTPGLWRAAASLMTEFERVTALAAPAAVDAAWVVAAAADLLLVEDDLATQVLGPLRLVVVDDAQELTVGTHRLLTAALAGVSGRAVLLGDPDAATQGFRGARPELFVDWARSQGASVEVLEQGHRLGPGLAAVAERITGRVGAATVAHRTPAPAARRGGAEALVLPSPHVEAVRIATELRREHVLGEVPWGRMAVVVRGRAQSGRVRRALERAGVPVQVTGGGQPLTGHPVVSVLIDLLEAAVHAARTGDLSVDEERALAWLGSPLGGLDAAGVRRLRRLLLAGVGEQEGAAPVTSGELLVAALTEPPEVWEGRGAELGPLRRLATALTRGVEAARRTGGRSGDGRAGGPGVTAEEVLWAVWDGLGVADRWQRTALEGGVAGRRADSDLDAVMSLFALAEQFTERRPGAGPEVFVETVSSSGVARDSLVLGARRDAVQMLTPQTAAGGQWEVVLVAGVQAGAWPDLRLRGSLLGAGRLVDLVEGRHGELSDQIAAVRHDETRQFLVACTRATRRLVVTAVRDAEEQPSPFLDLVDPLPPGVETRPVSAWVPPLDLPTQVARARRELLLAAGAPGPRARPTGTEGPTDGARQERGIEQVDASRRAAWAGELVTLARAGVGAADPDRWWLGRRPSSAAPPWPEGTLAVARPSALGTWQDCALKGFLTAHGGQSPAGPQQELGILVHDVLADHPEAPVRELEAAVDAQWEEFGSPEVWWSRRDRERLSEWLRRYDTYRHECGRELVATEVPLDVTVGGVRLVGRVDRVERHPDSGALHVADLKSGQVGSPKELPENPQLGAYQVAVEAGGLQVVAPDAGTAAVSGGASLVQLAEGQTIRTIDRRQAALAAGEVDHAARLQETGREMLAATHLATVGDACRHCPVRTSCPAQPEGGQVA
ncbi:Superfamily I DNA or RNA helicase [Kytococcus aerolatus]|uniref:DNA 3'-5' helicase n=1 Tax=Kytococcus aerolatus TaxID=592308 RepID=A0A212T7Y8_9MICO|nr:UrvD/REP family ATP-dependent DNA helicase [Kytococcus aerolatus]SNC61980.1 Superfamily I DNA or RNA helicase [Kytococcus aerolatus]